MERDGVATEAGGVEGNTLTGEPRIVSGGGV